MMFSGTTAGTGGAQTSPPDHGRLTGPRAHRSWLALVAALGACALVLALPQPKRSQPTNAPPVQTLSGLWPGIAVGDAKGVLDSGFAYTPLAYLDSDTSVGTAPNADNTQLQLVVRHGADPARTVHQLPGDQQPQIAGMTVAGDTLVWAETTVVDGRAHTEIWRADRRAGAATQVTADTGDVVFFNAQYDLVLADGAVHWAAAARTTDAQTEIRSVPLAGGKVTVANFPGAFALSAWPWLVSAGGGQTGAVDLINLDTKQKVTAAASNNELVTCTPTWCRVLVLGQGGPARYDLMHPDGTDRQRVAGGQSSPAVTDVAILDRFEVLAATGRGGSPGSQQKLTLYDARTKQTVEVATGVGTVMARAGLLWWSTGDNEALTWHVLDLHKIP